MTPFSRALGSASLPLRPRKIELSLENRCFLINGRSFVTDERAFDVKRGAVEVWRVSNPALGMLHPMGPHGFSFQALERLSSPAQVPLL